MKELDQILFQKYLIGTMDQDARQSFESRLEQEDSFRSSFELYQMMDVHLEERSEKEAALNVLKSVHEAQKKELPETAVTRTGSWGKWLAFAAIGLLLVIGFFFLRKQQLKTPQYAAVYQAPILPAARSGDMDRTDSLLVVALADFDSQPTQTVQRLQVLNIDLYTKSRWIVETYARHENAEQVLLFLPKEFPNKAIRDRMKYLEILAYVSKGDSKLVHQKIKALPADTDDYYKKIYSEF